MITILIVDDEREIVENVYEVVSKEFSEKYTIVQSDMSRQAKEILQTQVVDILLTDIRMPGFTGFDLSAIAKENNSECRVIFLTGYNDFDYAYQALKDGCDDFILKTGTNQDIIDSINKVILSIAEYKARQDLLLEAQRLKQLSQPSEGTQTDVIASVKTFIWNNIGQDISLNMLAKTVYLHPAYLSRIFKQETGVTITEYLVHARIEKSKELLLGTQHKVQDIATMVGVDSAVYFGRIFKKEVGMTPQEYRHQDL